MKESIGASWLYTLVIVLIALFTSFVSVTTNYTRTYKIKDSIITIIEKNGGVTKGDGGTLDQINQYLNSMGYTSVGQCPDMMEDGKSENWVGFSRNSNTGRSTEFGGKYNYCIYKHTLACRNNKKATGGKKVTTFTGEMGYNAIPRAYYGVIVFFKIDWPILREVIKFNLSGETTTLYLPNNFAKQIDEFSDDDKCPGFGD